MRRGELLVAATVILSGVTLGGACGGDLTDPHEPIGYVDDAGAFHLTDGAVLFSPGTGCVDFDAAGWTQAIDPNQDWTTQFKQRAVPCDADVQCAFVPGGYPFAGSGCNGGTCFVAGSAPVCCTPGTQGDGYCQAMFQQFVAAPEAKAMGYCAPNSEWDNDGIHCKLGGCLTGCKWPPPAAWSLAMFVERSDAAPQCENPCQP